ncbi:MAG: hypothetical protein HY079_12035, partial [Elusimicrobia bacterium]|nr:hypothetical protein [Elusimicrobiota bacterium]
MPERQLATRETVNATAAPLTAGLLHSGFAAQVARRRDETALIADGRRLTYGELDAEARALAGTL